MHIDENKKFDKRNLEKNIKSGIIPQKDYEIYLSKLPDVSDKLFNPEENSTDLLDVSESKRESKVFSKKKEVKKKKRGK